MGGVGSVRRSGWGAALLIPVLFFACGLAAEEPADSPRLVYADNGAWRSDLLVTNLSADTPARVRGTNCTFGPAGFDLTVAPDGGSRLFAAFGDYLCGARIGLVALTSEGTPLVSVYARYADADGNVTAFEIPPLTWTLRKGRVAEIPLVRSDSENETALIVFNEGTGYTGVRAAIYDGEGELVATEVFDTPPGLTVRLIETEVAIGRLELVQGLMVGCGPCSNDEPLYGFAAVGTRGGGSQRVIPFGPKLRFTTE